ncbi:MAG TPA: hypothetical protein VL614_20060 [Acetobacteraceae bacterium]|nr:hypothetical protein [Acetobacteraceae bacterium]
MWRSAMAWAVIALVNTPAYADLQVRVPQVDYLELEFEHNGLVTFDSKGSPNHNAQNYTNSVGYGVTPWWGVELEGEMEAGGGQHLLWSATTMENTFQITQPGQYFFNLGFFVEYSQSTLRGEPSSFTAGPIVQKELNNVLGLDTLHTLNLFLSRDVGHNATKQTGFEYAWQSLVLTHPLISPGVEFYGFIPDLAHAGPTSSQQHWVGPVLAGDVNFAPYGKLGYQVGYLWGLTPDSGRSAIRWRLEYEVTF